MQAFIVNTIFITNKSLSSNDCVILCATLLIVLTKIKVLSIEYRLEWWYNYSMIYSPDDALIVRYKDSLFCET